jgi:hypothetical protein
MRWPIVAITVMSMTTALAEPHYCLDHGDRHRFRRSGVCPTGYRGVSQCCEAMHADSARAMPKIGSTCPAGWFASGDACVRFRRQ